jgi:hypothetical protein
MIKKYIIARIKEKEKDIPCGHYNTTQTTYKLTSTDPTKYDTEEEALREINRKCSRHETWTILPVYVPEWID